MTTGEIIKFAVAVSIVGYFFWGLGSVALYNPHKKQDEEQQQTSPIFPFAEPSRRIDVNKADVIARGWTTVMLRDGKEAMLRVRMSLHGINDHMVINLKFASSDGEEMSFCDLVARLCMELCRSASISDGLDAKLAQLVSEHLPAQMHRLNPSLRGRAIQVVACDAILLPPEDQKKLLFDSGFTA